MSYDFLAMLAQRSLPAVIHEPGLIDLLRSYASAGLIEARIPSPDHRTSQPVQPPATVTRLTAEGHRTVRKFRKHTTWPM